MSVPDDPSSEVLWTRGQWRCERRTAPDGRLWVELFEGNDLALTRPVKDAEQLTAIVESWQQVLSGHSEGAAMPEPTRRRDGERRHSIRGGRRHEDEPPDHH